MQMQMSCNKDKYPPCCEHGCAKSRLAARSSPGAGSRAERPWLARRAGRTVFGRNVRLGADGEAGAVLAQTAGLSRPGLPGGGWLYGSRQLGDLARRRVAVRLRALDGGAAVERDGHRAA